MEAVRFREEIELLQREMVGFMKFYKNRALSSLGKEKEELQDLLKGTYRRCC